MEDPMSVLAEAISVIISRAAIDKGYPGGYAGFERDAPAETTCTDGHLARVGFYAMEDAQFFLRMLAASGIVIERDGIAVDAVLIDQNLGPARQCLWIELGRERDGSLVCWHAAARRGVLHVPHEWRPLRGPRLGDAPGRPFAKLVRYIKTEDSLDWYHDRRSGRLVSMTSPFVAH
jgi:hypothetical protein